MKTPPFLLGTALLFWGWQSDLLIAGGVMAVILEGARLIKVRWDFSNEDFSRIWTFCALLFLASGAYAFTANHGPGNVGELFSDPSLAKQNSLGVSSSKTAVLLIRWLPMAFFLFMTAQTYSDREGIPLETISLILRRRWKKARDTGQPVPVSRAVNVSYPYFIVCLFAATTHPTTNNNDFFWGLCALTAWALWTRRSRRFGAVTWLSVMGVAIALSYGSHRGLMKLQGIMSRYNPQWLADWMHSGSDALESRTALGQIGKVKMSHQIVLRLETPNGSSPPAYLREASYRAYMTGNATWSAGSSKDDFGSISENPAGSGKWPLLSGTTNARDLQIALYLPHPDAGGVLPLPEDAGLLEQLPMYTLQNNSVGTVRGTGPGLLIFHARYGSGLAMDAKPNVQKYAPSILVSPSNGEAKPKLPDEDLSVPEKERPALRQAIESLHIAGKGRDQIVEALNHYFATQFTYSLWQDQPKTKDTNMTAVGRFLLKTHSGHCEYFATATVLMLRELKIPARYTVGYAVHESSGNNKYVVRASDAHAWCRVWNDQAQRWEDFDTTPGTWIAEENKLLSPFQFIADSWSWLMLEFSKFRWGQSNLRQYIIWALVPILAFLLYQIIFRSSRRRAPPVSKNPTASPSYPGFDSEFYQLEAELVKRGMIRRTGEPVWAWLHRAAADPGFSEANGPLDQIVLLHYRYRFDPHGLSSEERESLRHEVALRVSSREIFGLHAG